MAVLKFDQDTISDQKRLVRGEHWLLSRSLLRGRDCIHHRPWRILTLAGGAPLGEVKTIRELMPRAEIVAVDRDRACLEAAIEAGVDDVIQCDLADFVMKEPGSPGHPGGNRKRLPAKPILERGQFDIINLDFCGGVSPDMREMVNVYSWILSSRGAMMITFSYGRDVTEMFTDALWNWRRISQDDRNAGDRRNRIAAALARMTTAGVPEPIMSRLVYLLTPGQVGDLVSVMLYKGAQMPMCALVFQERTHADRLSFIKTEPGDFEVAVVYPDSANLYDCPRERIEALRRRGVALKAAISRSANRYSGLLV